ncbi:MAG: heme exporter protein CcmB [Candidatus Schekmanbacteria bacterium]|nr:heme exporter protein CcmB [Candidatus Schekmanbacteria bacterium]
MNFFQKVWLIVWKDLVIELRTKEMLSAMFIFSLLVVIIFNFAFDPGMSYIKDVAPGILWVAITFAGTLGLNRSFINEQENGCLYGLMLAPIDRGAIYLGKFLGNLLFMLLIEIFLFPIFVVFFNLSVLQSLPLLLLIAFLATVGFAAVGTLLAGMAANTKTREILLPILFFPLVVPVIIAAVKSTGRVLNGDPMDQLAGWLQLLAAFDIIFLVVCFLTFEYVIEE